MRYRRVFRGTPSRRAAREMFHAVARSASTTCSRPRSPGSWPSAGSAVDSIGIAGLAADGSPSISAVSARASASSAARSMTFASSRTLPGHG
jgi:hypothetical protein